MQCARPRELRVVACVHACMPAKTLHTKKIQKYIEYLTQVPITTIMPDLANKEAIKMVGAETMRAPMEKGSEGRIVARFADGSVETLDISNLALEAAPPKVLKKPAAAKGPAYKRPAAAKLPAGICDIEDLWSEEEDESGDEETSEEEDSEDREEAEEEQQEAEKEVEEAAEDSIAKIGAVPPPLPATAKVPKDFFDRERN